MRLVRKILKAKRVGIRAFKERLTSSELKTIKVVTNHGKPVSVNLPYQDVLDLVDAIGELKGQPLK